jgi:hypothetical protein
LRRRFIVTIAPQLADGFSRVNTYPLAWDAQRLNDGERCTGHAFATEPIELPDGREGQAIVVKLTEPARAWCRITRTLVSMPVGYAVRIPCTPALLRLGPVFADDKGQPHPSIPHLTFQVLHLAPMEPSDMPHPEGTPTPVEVLYRETLVLVGVGGTPIERSMFVFPQQPADPRDAAVTPSVAAPSALQAP